MPNVDIDKKTYDEIKDYCKINGLKIGEFINKLVKKAFIVEKFGEKPPMFSNQSSKFPNNEPKKVILTNELEEKTTEQTVELPTIKETPVHPKEETKKNLRKLK